MGGGGWTSGDGTLNAGFLNDRHHDDTDPVAASLVAHIHRDARNVPGVALEESWAIPSLPPCMT